MSTTTLADTLRDRWSAVVDRRCLEDDSQGPDGTGGREQPQKQPVKDQRNVLPVFFDLCRRYTQRLR